ncbi:MAG TPA: hypothetical protein VN289_01125 [Paraburkholderia sp.]|nr:hypothetical protein [Paraburkholderia sp.]
MLSLEVRSGAGYRHADAAVTHRLLSHQSITIIRRLIPNGDEEFPVCFVIGSKSSHAARQLIAFAQFSIKRRKSAPALPGSASIKPEVRKVIAPCEIGIKYGRVLKIGMHYETFDSNRSFFGSLSYELFKARFAMRFAMPSFI